MYFKMNEKYLLTDSLKLESVSINLFLEFRIPHHQLSSLTPKAAAISQTFAMPTQLLLGC
jgi:hypothetical protein